MSSAAPTPVKDVPSSPASGPPPGAPRVHRHVRNYFLDAKLQLSYVLVVTVLSALIASGLGYLIWNQKNLASRTIIRSLNAPDASWIPEDTKNFVISSLHHSDTAIILKMAFVALGLMAILSLFLVVLTHKVAGPLYKMGLYFDRLRAGDLSKIADLRKGDQFQSFFVKFKAMHEDLRARARAEANAYERFLTACAAAGTDAEASKGLAALRDLRKKKEEALG